MSKIFTASIYFRSEKPFGRGCTTHERHTRIVGGWRAEVLGGLADGEFWVLRHIGLIQGKNASVSRSASRVDIGEPDQTHTSPGIMSSSLNLLAEAA